MSKSINVRRFLKRELPKTWPPPARQPGWYVVATCIIVGEPHKTKAAAKRTMIGFKQSQYAALGSV